ncbi:MAG: LysR family transcriptional regulator, partial [Myxococcota bacterium]
MTRKSNRIGQVWAWLPAFRAVAETQHLPTAAREFHLSVSALSRAVKSLEEQLERPLFIREGRSLTLSPAGRVLLGAVRDAMRRIDEGLTSIDGNAMKGAFIVASRGPYGSIFILPALDRLAEPYPDLIPCFESLPTDLVVPRLLEGSVDLVVS